MRFRALFRRSMWALSPCVLCLGCNEIDLSVPSFVELFQQSPWEKVDVLIVVDNSGSMEPYQNKLASDFGGFFDFFEEGEVDWQLGVIHTDATAPDFGRIRGPIVTSEAADPELLFAEVVNVGTEGGGLEAGLEAASRALKRDFQGFPRSDASTSVIFVSDEEDTSPDSVPDYINEFYDFHGQRNRQAFNASALTVTDLADCSVEQFAASAPGTRYIEVARVTGGISANLCVDDFAQIVLDLALTTSAMLDTFYLKDSPDLNTLTVQVAGEPVGCDEGVWTYAFVDREGAMTPAIVFSAEHIPEAGAEVLVEYLRGNGNPDNFCQGGPE